MDAGAGREAAFSEAVAAFEDAGGGGRGGGCGVGLGGAFAGGVWVFGGRTGRKRHFLLTLGSAWLLFRPFFTPNLFNIMAKVCQITGVGVTVGHKIHRSGKAKKEGGIGKHITKRVKRKIHPNLRDKRIWVSELGKFVNVRLSARALKTLDKNGAFATLKEAGLI